MTDNQIKAGTTIHKSDVDFEKAMYATLFNKRQIDRFPDTMVVPQTVQEVIEAVKYARSVGKKISVCSGGHSWSANHLRPGSVLINMSQFRDFTVDAATLRATAGPGVGGSILLEALYRQQLFFPAGHCKGVCIGGYLLQGGFAWNGRKLGMACESVLGIDLVTADGEFVHASADENPDLYWAARGAGGGFFGVVVRFHLKLYPLPKYRGIMVHSFPIKHLEHVFRWAYETGPDISPAVEFQMLMSRTTMGILGPGIEAAAPVFADTKDELEAALAFMRTSPIKNKASVRMPFFDPGISMLYRFAMTHYPHNRCWGGDNMWTHATIDDLLPFLRDIAATLPPAPSHLLWLNWYPPQSRQDISFSMEDNLYIALYGCWKSQADTSKYGDWATEFMKKMAHLATGIQLADENLHRRTAPFMAPAHLQKLDLIRASRDPGGAFHAWHSRP